MNFGRSTVDFVRQQKVCENRTFFGREFTFVWAVDQGSDHVGGEQVGRELDTLEFSAHALSQSLDRKGFGKTGHPLEQDVSIGQQTDDQAVDQVFLTNDDATHLLAKKVHPGCFGLYAFLFFRGRGKIVAL